MTKECLGDGVYINNDGYSIELTTGDGAKVTNTIYIESIVLAGIIFYAKRNNIIGGNRL